MDTSESSTFLASHFWRCPCCVCFSWFHIQSTLLRTPSLQCISFSYIFKIYLFLYSCWTSQLSQCLLILDIAFISIAVWLFVQTHVFIFPEFVITNKSDGLCESKCLTLNERIRMFSNVIIPFHVPTSSV